MTGTYIFDRKTNEFVLRKGPIFCQVLLADEINRAPAKTQSALLEAMQEYQVTIEGTTLPLPRPFMVLATQNPVEQEGVYRLPEAQLDRFLLRVEMGYPGHDAEVRCSACTASRWRSWSRCSHPETILDMQASLQRCLRQGRAAALHRRPGRGEPAASGRVARRQPAGVAVPAAAAPGQGRAGGPALLHARGRAGRGPRRAGPSPDRSARGRGRRRHVSDVVSDLLESVPVLEST